MCHKYGMELHQFARSNTFKFLQSRSVSESPGSVDLAVKLVDSASFSEVSLIGNFCIIQIEEIQVTD